ncbi:MULTISPECIES: hypothetical protein [unclassified Rhodococcus (in: high G+C Gram-positive bacteria)]|uniref:hypothetical protein n=1 Tax=unclassified Rhodococcus (in: high G+C Gram-positive bacteria) TaxID=192944 RepID=UPI00117A58CB|nr:MULTISPECIES: hypothetical protein [unclassified Rhodococcus (in: high G+C Gram-positive bacteria)]
MPITRQIPKATDLREVLSFDRPDLNLRRRRLNAVLTIDDLRTIARRRTPRAAFDYTDGAAAGILTRCGSLMVVVVPQLRTNPLGVLSLNFIPKTPGLRPWPGRSSSE